ncbi:valine--tRNA ligase [Bradymonas sediminis]|uniref:Valine--tRNA ligase n=1 Tax=Bradymonas sediminis TaxID=1548548 RepID=A0A2Z4FPF7_9DELT|nr:valine--tRNA ligase [Bradymonas sediminis]AWV90843.1 valine--tRNA ligase [Bradymonas sediminis]TDP75421.1 valyl-tRNA synthetase [Bradymonas sediminis]
MKIDQSYNPVEVEAEWYDYWVDKGYFHADETSDKEPFTIVIPPPNVTGRLHMGHALFVTLQDMMIRQKRMQGFETLWLPGTDHAGIATQVMVERQLAEEGTNRHEIGREEFMKRAWAWKEEHGGQIIDQLKRMGASCDWERERFTLDDGLNRSVNEAFVKLYNDGLIYRGLRMVDWDPVGQTVLSDLEVDREEESGHMWYFKYPLSDGSGHITIGTTRPETMLGDTAVAVHPDDERYQGLIGKTLDLPIVGRKIPIIADSVLPDPEKGTGAVKITPAHDPNDWECGERHELEVIQVIGFDATMNENAPEDFVGLDRYDARKLVVKKLKELGLFDRVEDTQFAPGRSERTGVVVEPLPMLQWFVNAEPMAKKATDAVESGRTEIIPAVWKKTYDHFMYNIRPWCISRQLWWGHQIPAWYCDDCEEVIVSLDPPTACPKCASENLTRDPDVLDTWFSSALWPFSTMGWPEETATLKKFYPTQVMETGFDILFFWVARMMMMGLWLMDDVPFEKVFLHAMVRDKEGNKMSKTKGNVVDPLHMIYGADAKELDAKIHAELLNQYPDGVGPQGADALRFTLAIYAAAGRDIKLDIKRIEGYRAFLNKLWNAARFALMNLEGYEAPAYQTYLDAWTDADAMPFDADALSVADRWILSRCEQTVGAVTKALDEFQFNEAAQLLYKFVWNELCDWYIELSKDVLHDGQDAAPAAQKAARDTLTYVLDATLRLMHPITPFITEDIWQALPHADDAPDSVMIAPWPVSRADSDFAKENAQSAAQMDQVIELITAIRAVRGETNVKPGRVIETVYFVTADADAAAAITAGESYIQRLAKAENIVIQSPADAGAVEGAATAVRGAVEIRIPLLGLIDVTEELARLDKELARVQGDIKYVTGKLGNARFVDNAPEAIVAKERAKHAQYLEEQAALMASRKDLEALAGGE